MAIDVVDLRGRVLDPEIEEELAVYQKTVGEYLAGEVEEDVFRVFRLNQGIYGQRQGGHHQMVRVKIPYGKITPEQLEVLGFVSETYSRGWGHLTTRQNVQFHFVPLEQTPEVSIKLGAFVYPATARIVVPDEPDDALIRRLLVEKHRGPSQPLDNWGRTALPVLFILRPAAAKPVE